MTYSITKNLPVARFYYKGNHSHPVKRTVLIIESNEKWFKGYELREGSETRSFAGAPVKTYSRSKVARLANCRFKKEVKKTELNKSTLRRTTLIDLITNGI